MSERQTTERFDLLEHVAIPMANISQLVESILNQKVTLSESQIRHGLRLIQQRAETIAETAAEIGGYVEPEIINRKNSKLLSTLSDLQRASLANVTNGNVAEREKGSNRVLPLVKEDAG